MVRSSLVLAKVRSNVPQVETAAQRRHLMDHDLWLGPGDCLADADRVEPVDDCDISARGPQPCGLSRAPRRGGDVVPGRDELRHELLSDYAGCPGDEHSHGGVLLVLRF